MTLIIGTASGIFYLLADGDNFLLPANIVDVTESAIGMPTLRAIDSGHNITIDGTLIGFTAIELDSLGSGNHVTINATGTAAGTSFAGIDNNGAQASIVNAGLVTGRIGIAMLSDSGTGSTIFNSGRIIAEDRAIDHESAGEKLTFTNTGTVTSYNSYSFDSNGLTAVDSVINSGTMTGAVYLGGGNDSYNGAGGRVISGLGYDVFGAGGKDSLRGGSFSDALDGGSDTDFITGRGGKDILWGGGTETDHFYYNALSEVGDTMMDFTTADFLHFRSTAFGSATIGTCSAANFRSNLSGLAEDGDDRFIYETDQDILWFDSNGTGSGGRVQVTDFAYDVALTRADIIIF